MTATELVEKASRYRGYFGDKGGITLSGGEPLLQAAFVREVFSLCCNRQIHTCLDTSGCVLNDAVKAVLDVTDRVLLDVKYTNDQDYRQYVGTTLDNVLGFLGYLDEKGIPTTIRQVIIPTLNDTEENVEKLRKIVGEHSCVDGVELLPFRKICQVKYDEMGITFPFAHLPEPTAAEMERWKKRI